MKQAFTYFVLAGVLILPLLLTSIIIEATGAVKLQEDVLTLKWERTGLPNNWEGGMVAGDINDPLRTDEAQLLECARVQAAPGGIDENDVPVRFAGRW